jgi:hypothetical protein
MDPAQTRETEIATGLGNLGWVVLGRGLALVNAASPVRS